MAIAKITKSGKSVEFVDDFGNVFITSKVYLLNYLAGVGRQRFLLLKRLPNPISLPEGFVSPVFGDEHGLSRAKGSVLVGSREGVVSRKDSAWEKPFLKERDGVKVYNRDIEVD